MLLLKPHRSPSGLSRIGFDTSYRSAPPPALHCMSKCHGCLYSNCPSLRVGDQLFGCWHAENAECQHDTFSASRRRGTPEIQGN